MTLSRGSAAKSAKQSPIRHAIRKSPRVSVTPVCVRVSRPSVTDAPATPSTATSTTHSQVHVGHRCSRPWCRPRKYQ